MDQANSHATTLRELGASLESELEPSVVDLQDRSVTLSGTVEDQFKEWRGILQKIFENENGIEPVNSEAQQTNVDSSENSAVQ